MFHKERDTGLGFAVEGDVDGIEAGEVEFQLLESDNEIACAEMGIAGEHDFGWEIDSGHDELAVGVDEIQAQFVRAFVFVAERDAQGDGALRVRGGNLLGDDGVKCPEQVELAVFFRGGIAQHRNLNIHPAGDKHETGQLARISLCVFRECGGWKLWFLPPEMNKYGRVLRFSENFRGRPGFVDLEWR